METSRYPIHLISGQPTAWTQILKDQSFLEQGVRRSERWSEITNVKPEDTHLSIIMPIHNEKKLLSSVLGSMLFSNLPFDAPLKIICVSNNCNDDSPFIINTFLREACKPYKIVTNTDHQLTSDPQAKLIESGWIHNTEFIHVDTQTPGKGNALNIGNEIALQHHHPIAFCVDANNFVEPDGFSYLYRDAYDRLIQNPDGTAVLSGVHFAETDMQGADYLGRLVAKAKNVTHHDENMRSRPPYQVTGALMAWDTQWLDSVGKFPNTAAMDYGIGVIARHSGRKIAHSKEAVTWGFTPNNFTEKVNQAGRGVRGMLQLLDQFPDLRTLIEGDEHFWFEDSIIARSSEFLKKVKDQPKSLPSSLYQWVIWEFARQKGFRDFKQNPADPSWEVIQSTK